MSEKAIRLPRLRIPALAGFWYTVCSVIERGSAIIFTPIYTRLLLPEEYGIYSVYSGFMGIISVFATLEISGASVYRGLGEFKNKDRFLSSSIGLMMTASILSLLFYLTVSPLVNSFSELSTRLTLILFLQVFLNGVRALKLSSARFSYDKRLPLTDALFFSLAIPVLSISLIFLLEKAEYARIYALFFASLVFTVPILISALRRGKFRLYDKACWRFILKYTIPTLPHYLAMALIWQIGKITVASAFSSAEAALFSLAISIGLIPSILSSGMLSALLPWISRRLGDGKSGREKIYSLISSAFLPFCLLTALFLLLSPELIRIFASDSYEGALAAIYPVCSALPLSLLASLFSCEISYYKKTYFVTLGSVLGAVFSLFFNLLFTFRLGFVFSAYIIPLSFLIIVAVYSIILKRRFMHKELPFFTLIKDFFLFLLLVGSAAFLRDIFISRLLLGVSVTMLLIPSIKTAVSLCSE